MTAHALSTFVRVKERFARSANIERDADVGSIAQYIPTGRALDALARVALGIGATRSGRAFSITGPYGSGKSSFALFLNAILGPSKEAGYRAAFRILQEADSELAEKIGQARQTTDAATSGFIRAIVTAQREPIVATILRALKTGVIRFAGNEKDARLIREFRNVLDTALSDLTTAETLRHLVTGMTAHAPILLVIDEFGKNLEHLISATSTSSADDLYVLQELAEWSDGETPLPLILMTLQHLAFEDYVSAATEGQRREWSKVMGRFADLVFVEGPAQSQSLVTSVFIRDGLEARIGKWVESILADEATPGLLDDLYVSLADCYPLHPTTLAVLPDLCARYGQNERTLFSFLAGTDPLSVRSYLSETALPSEGILPTVRLDRVYDFFLESASTMVSASATASRWLEIETRIRDVQGLSAVDKRVLKAIGVLNLVSSGGALRASRKMVSLACSDGREGTESPERTNEILDSLESRGLVTYRDFADEYRIWAGSDFDLRGAVELARRRVKGEPLAGLLDRIRPPTPIIAARHSQATGTLRVFERRYLDGTTAQTPVPPPASSVDGLVLFCVDPDPVLSLDQISLSSDDKPVVIGFTEASAEIANAANELAAHQDVLKTTADLESDWVARRELRERASIALQALDAAIERAFGPSGLDVRWMRIPGLLPISAAGGLSAMLSTLCDELYPDAPLIRNEMLARRELTSQGAKARRDLLAAMVEHASEQNLGLTGYGPERAMYEAILRKSGIHQLIDETWSFQTPHPEGELKFAPTWASILGSFEESTDHQVPLSHVFEQLMDPPIGLKEGPIPVLVTAALIAQAADIAVYEEGSFVARLTPDVSERMIKNPSRFNIRKYASFGPRRDVIASLASVLGAAPGSPGKYRVEGILSLISPILSRARSLPVFSQRTTRGSHGALAVRSALFSAREPDQLLFVDLPKALGFPSISARDALPLESSRRYGAALAAAMQELESFYPELLCEIEESLTLALVAPPPDSMRADLRVRAARLVDQILEPRLRSLVAALTDQDLDRGDWLEYVGMVVSGRTVQSWADDDVGRFKQQLGQLASAFKSVEALHFMQSEIPTDGFRAVRVTVTRSDGFDASRVVRVDDSAFDLVNTWLHESMLRISETVGATAAEEMILAGLAMRVLLSDQRESANAQGDGDLTPPREEQERHG